MQAQANLDLLDKQIAKLDVFASIDGVILTRNVEPGEFVQPGAVRSRDYAACQSFSVRTVAICTSPKPLNRVLVTVE